MSLLSRQQFISQSKSDDEDEEDEQAIELTDGAARCRTTNDVNQFLDEDTETANDILVAHNFQRLRRIRWINFLASVLVAGAALALFSPKLKQTIAKVFSSSSSSSSVRPDDDDSREKPAAVPPPTDHFFCNCPECSDAVLDTLVGNPPYSCRDRITWLHTTQGDLYPAEEDACFAVAMEFPCDCRKCDPTQCNRTPKTSSMPPEPVNLPLKSPSDQNKNNPLSSPAGAASMIVDKALYCFPPADQGRIQFELWNKSVIVQAKDSGGSTCGPGDNIFDASLVSVNDQGNELKLAYRNGKAAEVRIIPGYGAADTTTAFGYGTYSFGIKSIETVYKQEGGRLVTKQNELPKFLVLGLFTWDDSENYATHEHYNHEVDIEISRWNCGNGYADVQFVLQPFSYPHTPNIYRFYSGMKKDDDDNDSSYYQPGGQTYNISWIPGRIDWSATAGRKTTTTTSFTRTTAQAVLHELNNNKNNNTASVVVDYIQCLPDESMEVRINLWNMAPTGGNKSLPNDIESVEVVLDQFSFTPSPYQDFIPDGQVCSKDCQCQKNHSLCIDNRCSSPKEENNNNHAANGPPTP